MNVKKTSIGKAIFYLDKCKDEHLTCIMCMLRNCDSEFTVAAGGHRTTFGLHLKCYRKFKENEKI